VRGHRLLLVLGVCALLATPSAGGDPAIPGDPTPPVVTPHFFGTMGLNGWWVSDVTLNWTVEDPESPILETRGCDAVTLTADTPGTSFTCYARSDGGETQESIPEVASVPLKLTESPWLYQPFESGERDGVAVTTGPVASRLIVTVTVVSPPSLLA